MHHHKRISFIRTDSGEMISTSSKVIDHLIPYYIYFLAHPASIMTTVDADIIAMGLTT